MAAPGQTFAEAAGRFADLIAVHELGHLHAHQLPIPTEQGWLSEFLATYLSYSFLSAHRPDDAGLWFRMSDAHAAWTSSDHTSLEDLDELYFGVGPEAYFWYQSTLSVMIERVHASAGIGFVRELAAARIPRAGTDPSLG